MSPYLNNIPSPRSPDRHFIHPWGDIRSLCDGRLSTLPFSEAIRSCHNRVCLATWPVNKSPALISQYNCKLSPWNTFSSENTPTNISHNATKEHLSADLPGSCKCQLLPNTTCRLKRRLSVWISQPWWHHQGCELQVNAHWNAPLISAVFKGEMLAVEVTLACFFWRHSVSV